MANGIQALDRSKQVIVLTGDGGFNMLMGEFMTAVHHKLPIKVIVYNNSSLGLIKLEAESVGLAPFTEAINFPNPDFAALARACGGQGFTAKLPGDLEGAIRSALNADACDRRCGGCRRRSAECAASRSRTARQFRHCQDQGSGVGGDGITAIECTVIGRSHQRVDARWGRRNAFYASRMDCFALLAMTSMSTLSAIAGSAR